MKSWRSAPEVVDVGHLPVSTTREPRRGRVSGSCRILLLSHESSLRACMLAMARGSSCSALLETSRCWIEGSMQSASGRTVISLRLRST